MKALIFNSGLGSRLGELTHDRPKALVRLGNGETIFHRQLRLLAGCGICDFVVTCGPFPGMLEHEAAPFAAAGCRFTFVPNPDYATTNYLFSMYLARNELRGDDFLVLHGDLVFDAAYVQTVLDDPFYSLGSVNAALPLPQKDFKARIVKGEVREVSVGIFDDDCMAFQPFYKLTEQAMGIWLDQVERFVAQGNVNVYAENAANEVFGQMRVHAHSYERHFVEEVDTPEDLQRVSAGIRKFDFAQQPAILVWKKAKQATGMPEFLRAHNARRPLVVASKRFLESEARSTLDEGGADWGLFSGFGTNPTYDQVLEGVRAFRAGGYDSLLSFGGGSAIDVAKCIKLFAPLAGDGENPRFTDMDWGYSPIVHVAVPTTAGTGSESTHFAVCYVDGRKVSVAHDCLLPDAAVLDPSTLASLPSYQRKCTLLDALCQAIESYWSARSDATSRGHSEAAIPTIMDNWRAYLDGDEDAARVIMLAANAAGQAINLTTTTAPHAMSYELSAVLGIPHGHAVALCMPGCWQALLDAGSPETHGHLREIARLVTGESDAAERDGLAAFEELLAAIGLPAPHRGLTEDDIRLLVASVNPQRLANFPLALTETQIEAIYRSVLA